MMRVPRGVRRSFTALALGLLVLAAWAADVPFLTGRVNDNAELLKPDTRERISAAAKAHEDKTTDQIAVLTVPTIGSDSVEEYAVRVFERWKLGQKGKDNGVLIVVVPQDRKMRTRWATASKARSPTWPRAASSGTS